MRDSKTTLFIYLVCILVAFQANTQIQADNRQDFDQIRRSEQSLQHIVIPMDLSSRRPIVAVMLNGKGPYKFIFDTGSMAHVIDEKLSSEFGFNVVGEDTLRTPGSDSILLSKRVTVPKVGFSRTNILKDVEMNIINLRSMLSVDGILSSNFFEDYLLTMDYPNSNLEIKTGELIKGEAGAISFLQKPGVINFNLDVNGISVEAHLDTGSPGGISLPYSLKDQLTLKNEPKQGHTIRTPVASFKKWDAELKGDITLGNVIIKNPSIALVEGFKYANLGYDVIKDLRTTMDRKNSLIKFEQKQRSNSDGGLGPNLVRPMSSSYSGTYEGDRKVWQDESGDWVYQRAGSPISLKLHKKEADIFELKVPRGVRAPMGIPDIHFIRNEKKLVAEINLIYQDGRTEGPFKKIIN